MTPMTVVKPKANPRGGLSLERLVRIGAGVLVLLGVMLGLHVHPLFHLLSGITGAALIWAGVTDGCGLGLLLARSSRESGADVNDLSM